MPNNNNTDFNPATAVKELFLLSVLWMPLGFFLWFKFGAIFIRLSAVFSSWVLTFLMPESIEGIVQVNQTLEINTLIPADTMMEGKIALQVLVVNPMIYGYGLPVLLGLVMATPGLSALERGWQLVSGYILLSVVQTWGVVWEVMKNMVFSMGPHAAEAVHDLGLANTLVALCYQLGYLMLTPLAPLILWVIFNREFVNDITSGRFRSFNRTSRRS